jgi:hypothetical protein
MGTYHLRTERITYKCISCNYTQYIGTICLRCQKKDTMKVYQRCKKCHEIIWGSNAWCNGRNQMICKSCKTEKRQAKKAKENNNV